MWSMFKRAGAHLTGSIDDGSFFRHPWQWFYWLVFAVLGAAMVISVGAVLIGGVTTAGVLVKEEAHVPAVVLLSNVLRYAFALLCTGLIALAIWRVRRVDLEAFVAFGRNVPEAAPEVNRVVP